MLMLSSRTTNRFQMISYQRGHKKVEIVSRIARVARKTTHHINDG